jgi:hypothetical protein
MSPRVERLIREAADLSPAERLTLVKELVGSIEAPKEQMDRQRRAVLEFLAIPPVRSGSPDVSSNKHQFPKHDIEV